MKDANGRSRAGQKTSLDVGAAGGGLPPPAPPPGFAPPVIADKSFPELVRDAWCDETVPGLMRRMMHKAVDLAHEKRGSPDRRVDAVTAFTRMVEVAGNILSPKQAAPVQVNNQVVLESLRAVPIVGDGG